MNDERDGIDALRRAIDEVAGRLPPGSPRHRPKVPYRAVVAAFLVVLAATAAYRLVSDRAAAPAASAEAPVGVEVKFLRVRGHEVAARVFNAARAGTVVVAPIPEGGPR